MVTVWVRSVFARMMCLGFVAVAVGAPQPAAALDRFEKALNSCTGDVKKEVKIRACSDLIAGIRANDAGARDLADYLYEAIKFRGLTYADMKDYVHAMADFNELITRYPKDPYYYAKRSHIYEAKGDLDRAIADYDTVIRLEALSSDLTHRARLYLLKGDFDRAMADYAEAIRSDPKSAPLYLVERGEVYRSKGQLDRAIADFDEAIRLDSKQAAAYRNRGLAKKAKGDSFGGEADIAKAGELSDGLHRDMKNLDEAFSACSALMGASVDGFKIKNIPTLVKQCNADHEPGKTTCNDAMKFAKEAADQMGHKMPADWTCK